MESIDACNNLEITEIWPLSTEVVKNGGIGIEWSSDAGYGQLVLYWQGDKLCADTEHMCLNENKTFLKAVLNHLADKINIS